MKLTTEIFEREGKHNVGATIRIVAEAAAQLDIQHIVIFATSAQSVLALRQALHTSCQLVAVTFPAGLTANPDGTGAILAGIPKREDREMLAQNNIPVCQGVMPLRALGENFSPAIESMQRVFALFGGGTGLCVQAVLMACDGGYLKDGERCIVMTADTALIMRAGNAFRFLKLRSRAAIEHVLCKPLNYQISRPHVQVEINVTGAEAPIQLADRSSVERGDSPALPDADKAPEEPS